MESKLDTMTAGWAGAPRAGQVSFEGALSSPVLGETRFVRVYLPPSYNAAPRRRYPVLYVHDGQNAFSTAGDDVAYGWGNWRLDRTVNELSTAGRMREILVVAIDCGPNRYLDYLGPAAAAGRAAPSGRARALPSRDRTHFGRYSRFLMEELKPRIDREYRTRPGPESTAVMGSSMGGVCSLGLAWEHPGVFGLAASLSGAFQVRRRHFITRVLHRYEGRVKPIRIYLDSGVIDYSGSDDGCEDTAAAARELRRIGWRDGRDLMHFVDEVPLTFPQLQQTDLRPEKWKEAQTSQHNEFYWRLRAWRPLTFLFPPK